MKTLYFDCGMGAAGDMLMASLYEICPDKAGFLKTMNEMGLTGLSVEAEPAVKCGITGTHMKVTIHGEEEESVDVDLQEHVHDHAEHHEHANNHHEHCHDHEETGNHHHHETETHHHEMAADMADNTHIHAYDHDHQPDHDHHDAHGHHGCTQGRSTPIGHGSLNNTCQTAQQSTQDEALILLHLSIDANVQWDWNRLRTNTCHCGSSPCRRS